MIPSRQQLLDSLTSIDSKCPKCGHHLHYMCWNTKIGAIASAHCTLGEAQSYPLPAGVILCDFKGQVRRLAPSAFELVTE